MAISSDELVSTAIRIGSRPVPYDFDPGGQITTQGTIVNKSLNFTLPNTGGSGLYQGAGGQVVSRDVSTPASRRSVDVPPAVLTASSH